jgi:hypothetical protein
MFISNPERTMKRDINGSMMSIPRLSSLSTLSNKLERILRTKDLSILEVDMLLFKSLIPDTTKCGLILLVDISIPMIAKYMLTSTTLLFKATSMPKTEPFIENTKRRRLMKTTGTNFGISSTSIMHQVSLKDLQLNGECISTDHSISSPKPVKIDSLILLATELLLRLETTEILKSTDST